MTEQEWLQAVDPQPILDFLRGKTSERKLRLFAVACCRRIWPYLTSKKSRWIVEVSERYADGRVTQERLYSAWNRAEMASEGIHMSGGGDVEQVPAQAVCGLGIVPDVNIVAELTAATFGAVARGEAYEQIWQRPGKNNKERWAEDDAIRSAADTQEQQMQVILLRDIFGNPFVPSTLDSAVLAWNEAIVVRLAQVAYDERHLPSGTLDNNRLMILADALEEAGCTDADILGHLRGLGPHVRGCWPVDLCLGKS